MRILNIKYFIILLCLTVSSTWVNGQSKNVNIPEGELTYAKLFDHIGKQTEYKFAINKSRFNINDVVSTSGGNVSVEDVLDSAFKNSDYTYLMHGNQIIIVNKDEKPEPAYTFSTKYAPLDITDFERDVRETMDSLEVVFRIQDIIETVEFVELTPEYKAVEIEEQIVEQPSSYSYPAKYVDINVTDEIVINPNFYDLSRQPLASIKTNLLSPAILTFNLAVEMGMGKRTSLEVAGRWNPWNRDGKRRDNKKLVHWAIKPEFRYWFCERSNGHFIGVHTFYTRYNISGYRIPGAFKKDYRYKGDGIGGGVSYGYHLMLHKRWGFEFTLGLGAAHLKYDKFECFKCGNPLGKYKDTYVGVTNAGVKLVFLIK